VNAVKSWSPDSAAAQACSALFDRRRIRGEHAAVAERVDDELPAHAVDRLLACGIDVGDGDVVCGGERLRQVAGEVAGARVQVRLEEHAQP